MESLPQAVTSLFSKTWPFVLIRLRDCSFGYMNVGEARASETTDDDSDVQRELR